jgi:hypothetical protein
MNDEPPQNLWQFLIIVWDSLWTHATRALGVAVGTLTVLTSTGIVPESHLKYYLAAIAILTYWRGQGNANTIADKVVAKTAAVEAAKIVSNTPPEKLG